MNKLFAILVALCAVQGLSARIINCYLESWAYYRTGDGKFTVDNIDPNLCTHISYAFFGLGSNNQVKSMDTYLDYDLGYIAKVVALKKKNPKLKIMASIGGWSEGSTKYSNMAASSSSRKTFINSVVSFLKTHGFDGMDLDWEYPGQRGGSSSDRANFVYLLGELETAFAPYGYQLSIAVGADEGLGKTSYDIAKIAKEVNFINLMTYDYVSGYESYTGFNAPLGSVEKSVNYWLNQGAPANKLVIGIGFYGHSFTLRDSNNHGVGAPASGPGKAGTYTGQAGYLAYNEICTKGWATVFNTNAQDPYSYSGNQWVGYDNAKSIDIKMDFALKKNLAGAMMWAVDNDDFRGKCGSKYPLLNAMYKKMK